MLYGEELVKKLEDSISRNQAAMADRWERINKGWTDMDDCFMSQRCEERGVSNDREKIDLIKNGGCAWFTEYATLDGKLVNAHWCNTQFGSSLRAVMPDGDVVWTTARTAKGLARKGLKMVRCLRPAWFKFHSNASGMMGVYSGEYVLFPSDVNYATGERASDDPIAIEEYEGYGLPLVNKEG